MMNFPKKVLIENWLKPAMIQRLELLEALRLVYNTLLDDPDTAAFFQMKEIKQIINEAALRIR